MFVKIFVGLCEASPKFKKLLWRQWYQYLARGYTKSDWKFMNYGFHKEGFSVPLESDQEADRYSIQLYHYVAQPGQLQGKRVLEVGCGRGGGAEYVCRAFQPKQMTGVDFSSQAIDICRSQRAGQMLKFLQGDAEALPLEDQSIDVVINVESSHCYGSMDKFLAEVSRVLVPGGMFLMADLRQKKDLELLDQQLDRSGMVMVEREDITSSIVRSIVLDDERKRAFIERLVSRRVLNSFREFAGVRHSTIARLLATKGIVYQRFVMQKT